MELCGKQSFDVSRHTWRFFELIWILVVKDVALPLERCRLWWHCSFDLKTFTFWFEGLSLLKFVVDDLGKKMATEPFFECFCKVCFSCSPWRRWNSQKLMSVRQNMQVLSFCVLLSLLVDALPVKCIQSFFFSCHFKVNVYHHLDEGLSSDRTQNAAVVNGPKWRGTVAHSVRVWLLRPTARVVVFNYQLLSLFFYYLIMY